MSILRTLRADPDFWGVCPCCSDRFALAEAHLFELTDALPEIALAKIVELKAELKQQRQKLARAKHLMTERAAATAQAVQRPARKSRERYRAGVRAERRNCSCCAVYSFTSRGCGDDVSLLGNRAITPVACRPCSRKNLLISPNSPQSSPTPTQTAPIFWKARGLLALPWPFVVRQ
jgi:hypothetical protein